jgi:hypothetical protein
MEMLSPPFEQARRSTPSTTVELQRLFASAARRSDELRVCTYRIADAPVRLEFAGTALADLIEGAFAHLAAPAAEPALTVRVWDSATTGTEAPALAEELPDVTDGTGPVAYHEHGDFQALARWRTVSAYDAAASTAWFWAPSAGSMLSWDWASPLRSILHWWLARRGILQVHGGAVGFEDGGLLLVGRGGSGKSTSTLSTIGSELLYAGDDFVALERGETPRVHSLYSSGKLEPHHSLRFPNLAAALVDFARADDEKVIFHVNERFPGTTSRGFPLRAVVVPRVVGGPTTRVVPASPATALAALAPSTVFQLHPPQADALQAMADIVRRVPAFMLELGTDVSQIPTVLAGLLAELR